MLYNICWLGKHQTNSTSDSNNNWFSKLPRDVYANEFDSSKEDVLIKKESMDMRLQMTNMIIQICSLDIVVKVEGGGDRFLVSVMNGI